MNDTAPNDTVVIVGAGPSGTRAAETLVRAGLKPVVIDEAPASGGQIYRRQPPGFRRPIDQLYGYEAPKARRLHDTFDALAGKIDYRPGHAGLGRSATARSTPSQRRWDKRQSQPALRRADPGDRRDGPRYAAAGLDHCRRLHPGRRADRAEVPGLRHRQARSSSSAPGRCSTSSPTSTPRPASTVAAVLDTAPSPPS
jgi:phytoene dehydrogenase-like protein